MLRSTVTFKGNLLKELEAEKDKIRDGIVTKFDNAARAAIMESPVWSGAYVNSFSALVNGSGPTRSRKSNRDVRVDASSAKGSALRNISSDTAVAWSTDLEDLKSLTLVNRAPHATAVEMGTPTQPSGSIFARFRDRMRTPFGRVLRGRRS